MTRLTPRLGNFFHVTHSNPPVISLIREPQYLSSPFLESFSFVVETTYDVSLVVVFCFVTREDLVTTSTTLFKGTSLSLVNLAHVLSYTPFLHLFRFLFVEPLLLSI